MLRHSRGKRGSMHDKPKECLYCVGGYSGRDKVKIFQCTLERHLLNVYVYMLADIHLLVIFHRKKQGIPSIIFLVS